MDINQESILKELTNFEKNYNEVEQIPEILEKYLNNVARSGDIVFKWEQMRALLKKKIEKTIVDFYQSHPYSETNQPNVKPFDFNEVKRNILNGIDSFTGAPFTIQRICELLVDPYRHYKRADKFMKGLEKNVLVVSEQTEEYRPTNGNSTSILCLNSTFTLPSTSDSINNQSQQTITFHNGYKENETDFIHNNCLAPHSQTTSTIQQLDSFTTVFVTSQSTSSHLERIASLPIPESSSTTNLVTDLASSSQSNNTSTQSVDVSIENTPKIEISQLEQQTVLTSADSFVAINFKQNDEKEFLDKNEVEEKSIDDKSTEQMNTRKKNSTEQIKEDILSEQILIEPNKSELNNMDQEQKENATLKESNSKTPIKDQSNELKRVCESPDDEETMKRFKSNKINDSNETDSVESFVDDTLAIIEPKPDSDQTQLEKINDENEKSKVYEIEIKQSEELHASDEEKIFDQNKILDEQQTQIKSDVLRNEEPVSVANESKSCLQEENSKTSV